MHFKNNRNKINVKAGLANMCLENNIVPFRISDIENNVFAKRCVKTKNGPTVEWDKLELSDVRPGDIIMLQCVVSSMMRPMAETPAEQNQIRIPIQLEVSMLHVDAKELVIIGKPTKDSNIQSIMISTIDFYKEFVDSGLEAQCRVKSFDEDVLGEHDFER